MVHGRVRIQLDQRAIAGERLLHFAVAQQRLGLRLKVDEDGRSVDEIGHLVAQRCSLGHGVAALHGIEHQVRQHHAVLAGGECLRQLRGAERDRRILRQLLGHKSRGRNETIAPLRAEGGIQPPIVGARLLWLIETGSLLLVGIVFLFELFRQELEKPAGSVRSTLLTSSQRYSDLM